MYTRLLRLTLAIVLAAVYVGGVELHLLTGCPGHRHDGDEAHACSLDGHCAPAEHAGRGGEAPTIRIPGGAESAESAQAVCRFCLALFDAGKSFIGGATPTLLDAPAPGGPVANLFVRADVHAKRAALEPIRGPPFPLHV